MRPKLKSFPILATAILLALLIRLFTSGLTWVGVSALVIATLWWGFEFVRWLLPRSDKKRPKEAKQNESSPPNRSDELISLVYFLSEIRSPEESMIRSSVSSALNQQFDVSNPESEHFVMQFNPPEGAGNSDGIQHFMVRLPEGLFAVLVSDRPYIDNPEEFARQSIRDKRLRNAVEEHRAWLSVDLMDVPEDADDIVSAYRVIGKILASLAGPDCLAIYCPELQRCNEFDLSLIDRLASEDPLTIFDEPTFEPIIEISDNNPRMAAAVDEANQRWPEFVDAFSGREDPQSESYIIKAEFREGAICEYMWVSVTEIRERTVHGVLMNDPHELLELHRGAPVEVDLERLNDWIYPREDGSHAGGFTLDVLAEGDE